MLEFAVTDVRIGARAANREDAIRQAGELLVKSRVVEPGYIASMLERERLASTYLGKGVAIPHGLPQDRGFVLKTGIAVLQLPEGVEWQPASLARIVVAIAAKSDEHLGVLAKLTALLSRDDLIGMLASTRDAEQIVTALAATPLLSDTASDAATDATAQWASDAAAARVEAKVGAAYGLHARSAAAFAEAARRFDSQVGVLYRLKAADGKSMASLLQLGARPRDTVTIFAKGPDAEAALRRLKLQMERVEEGEQRSPIASHGWTPRNATESVRGISASPGLGIGRIHRVSSQRVALQETAGDPAREKQRLRAAIALAREQLNGLHEEVRRKTGERAAAIFRAHHEFIGDPALLETAEGLIGAGKSAAWAWRQTFEEQASGLEGLDNPVLASRAADLRDAGARVLANLAGSTRPLVSNGGEPALRSEELILLIAEQLSPSEVAALDPSRVAGFCTSSGGSTSHAAVLARSLSIPAVVGAGTAVFEQAEGTVAILDADGGVLYLNPAEPDLASARAVQQHLTKTRGGEYERRFEPAITTDGIRVEVCANIGRTEEARQAVEGGGEGVGVVRSEFLFLHRDEPPSEEEQYEAYRQMTEALAGLPLVLRTLDIGGDKSAPYIVLPPEENPFLGVRGIRLCLRNPGLFRTQLRAAYRASAHGTLKLLFPMVATVAEMRAARTIAEEVRREVGVPPVEIGAMIEVPSAVVMAPELAREADFFSIGTNDLTQYALAMDRGNALLARQTEGPDPAVLRMIGQTVRAAAGEGKRAAVCGELAGDPLGAVILIGLGVTELSMAIPSIAGIKARIRGVSMADAQELARRALACGDRDAVLSVAARSKL